VRAALRWPRAAKARDAAIWASAMGHLEALSGVVLGSARLAQNCTRIDLEAMMGL
jgi:hypothetical protein